MRVLLIDNYDSFTFNLVQSLRTLGAEVLVRRNDAVDAAAARALAPTHLVVSPGPGLPEDAGNTMRILEDSLGRVPILGVCLGHQALARVLGARVVPAAAAVHGRASRIWHDGQGLFAGLPNPFVAGRYHSWVVDEALAPGLALSAWSDDGLVMAMRAPGLRADGVQFHPESLLTPRGAVLLRSFLDVGEPLCAT